MDAGTDAWGGRKAVEVAWQLGMMLRYDESSVPSKGAW
jgi:hypothetical protein